MTPSQRDPALKPSVFPNLGRGLPAAASAGQPQAEPRHRAASLGSWTLVDSPRQGQERLLGRPPCALRWEGHGWMPPVSQDHLRVAPPQGGLCGHPNKCFPEVWCGSRRVLHDRFTLVKVRALLTCFLHASCDSVTGWISVNHRELPE